MLVVFSTPLAAQNILSLEIKASQKKDQKLISNLKYRKKFPSDSLRTRELNLFFSRLAAEGYVDATQDSSIQDKTGRLSVFISLNNAYEWEKLSKGNLNATVIDEINFSPKDFDGQYFNYHKLIAIEESVIKYYENHGYPFASIKLDSIKIRNHKINAAFRLTEGPLIHIDTIIIEGYNKIHPKYIYRLLDIAPGNVYNEQKIQQIERQLSTMNFASEQKPALVAFRGSSADIKLFLQKQQVNIFDGVIGFQPNTGQDNKLVLTGNLRLKLLNSFKRGELIDINWQAPQGASQNLQLHFAYPYLFNSPIGVDYEFGLLKQDSTFINIRNKPGFLFMMNGLEYVKISGDFFTSNSLGETDTNNLPPDAAILDMNSQVLQLELNLNRLDYIFNPRKGWTANLSAGYGTKKIVRRHDINDSYYDSIPLKSDQFNLKLQLSWFIPIFKRQTILLANKSALMSGDYLLNNQLYRIGGFSSLRGFDELSLYASAYSIFTVEWRLLVERNSYINVFWNGAYVENSSLNHTSYDQPMGFGAGISFQTKAGIFTMAYALGRQQGNPVQFNEAKIHFGYSARF
jgi:outer membrane protein assembly factor BamA